MANQILILNGADLDEPVDDLRRLCRSVCKEVGLDADFRVAADSGDLRRRLVDDGGRADAVIVNPGAANRDASDGDEYRRALAAIANGRRSVTEVHLDNIFAGRDDAGARPHRPAGPMGLVCGLGLRGYALAIRAAAARGAGRSAARARRGTTAGTVLVINGPNLNLLGTREPGIYGADTLDEIAARCRETGHEAGLDVEFFQSNHEGRIVDRIQDAIGKADAMVINAAAYTHTSVAIHDALRAYDGYKIELHISNPHARESFRHVSYVAPVADAVVAGLGPGAYELVIETLGEILDVSPGSP